MPVSLPHSDLVVHVTGREEGPSLLLLHGFAGSAHCWPDAVDRWSGDYRVVTVDARGHGDSPRWTPDQLEDQPWQVLVDDLVVLLEDLAAVGILRPVLVGHSMGAGTAAAASARRPELVRALVLEDPPWDAEPAADDPVRATRHEAWFTSFRVDMEARIAERRRERPGWPESELAPWAMAKVQAHPEMLASPRLRPEATWRDTVTALDVPTLVVTGDQDDAVIVGSRTRAELDSLANAHLTVAVVAGASHTVRCDNVEAYHAVVDPFIARAFA